jgi:FKBP-type peptidyl-prolyl cis-trans isomerase (trigger factor)
MYIFLLLQILFISSQSQSQLKVTIVKESNDIHKVCVRDNDRVDMSYIGYYKVNDNDNNNNDDELQEFDRSSSVFTFRVGEDKIIAGLNKGIIGACIGESRLVKLSS